MPRKAQLTIYMPDKEKQRLYRIADATGYSRQDFFAAAMVTGAVIIQALDAGELKRHGFGKTMLAQGKRLAAALMALGVSSVLNRFILDVSREMDITQGIDQFLEDWEAI